MVTNPKVDAIGVENLRAVSWKMLYGELIYELAEAHGKRIVPRDMPDIFDLNPHPNQSYSRRAVLNAQEFEKDSIWWRTSHALIDKLAVERKKGDKARLTQEGDAKVNGRLSFLEEKRLSASTRNQMITQCKRHKAGKFGWRTLAKKLSEILKLVKEMSHEAARRTSTVLLRD